MNRKIVKHFNFLLLLIATSALFTQCTLFEKKQTENEAIYECFKEWYLWYDELSEIDPNSYDDYNALIDALRVNEDRWSFVQPRQETLAYFEQGSYKGFGCSFSIDSDNQIKISNAYSNSPLGLLGVKRGWIVKSVAGFTVEEVSNINIALNSDEPLEFVMLDYEGIEHTFNVAPESFVMNTVLKTKVFEIDSKRIGYLVFNSFVNTAKEELKTAFNTLKQAEISDIIVDLRYNGGGLDSIAYQLINMIGGTIVDNKIIDIVAFNEKHNEYNKTIIAAFNVPKVNVNSVTFITTQSTASASEFLINNIKPYLPVTLVGNKTHGKPVGMILFDYEDYGLTVAPIAFKHTNVEGYGDYYDGIEVDVPEIDDVTKDWGDPNERMLSVALQNISQPASVAKMPVELIERKSPKQFNYKGFHRIIGAY